MRTFLIRFSVVVIAASLQISFFNVLFSGEITVELLPLIVLAWIILVGFENIWPWVVTLGVIADLVFFEKVGINSIFFIAVAYAISFFSRRFMVERRSESIFVLIFLIILSLIFLNIGRIIVSDNFSLINFHSMFKEFYPSWKMFFINNILNLLFFYGVYLFLGRLEKNIERHENKVNIIS